MLKKGRPSGIHRGQLVRVRTEREIAFTLDIHGKLYGMPFMPEMARYCGQIFRVYRRTGKTCVEGHSLRRLNSTVLLEGLRCDGAFHDGCQRNCLYFWKEAWLEPLAGEALDEGKASVANPERGLSAWASHLTTKSNDRYVCQSTELHGATQHLSRWNFTHFFSEIRDGELSTWRFLQILMNTVSDRIRGLMGLKPRHAVVGTKEEASRGRLDLKAGDWVEVKSTNEIRLTLDSDGRNHGLSFEPDMVDFAERRFQVEFPIQKIILEQTGKMIPLANTVALKGVACEGHCTKNCPRNNTLYWREIWLKRVEEAEHA